MLFNLHDLRKNRRNHRRTSPRRSARRSGRSAVPLALEVLEDRILMTAGDALFIAQTGTTSITDTMLYRATPSGNIPIRDFGNDIVSNLGNNAGGNLVTVGSKVYFSVVAPSNATSGNGAPHNQLWVSDGTSAGTQEVYDADSSRIGTLAAFGNKILFTLISSTNTSSDTQLWVSDGTSSGTSLIKDFKDEIFGGPTTVGSRFYFTLTSDQQNGNMNVGDMDVQLYVSDGTPSGTVSLADTGSGSASSIGGLTPVGGKLAFSMVNSSDDNQLWATDGTKAGTDMVFDTQSQGNANLSDLTAVGSNLYFDEFFHNSLSGPNDNQLWVSNLTPTGTTMLKDFGGGDLGIVGFGIVAAGNQVYIDLEVVTGSGENATTDSQLLALTASGPTKLADNVYLFVPVGNQMYFANYSTSTTPQDELNVTSGTQSTTTTLFNFGGSIITSIVAAGSQAYIFTTPTSNSSSNPSDTKLYGSDGTSAGTIFLADLGSAIVAHPLLASGSQLYFSTTSASSTPDNKLYTSDGTLVGTTFQDFGANVTPMNLAAITAPPAPPPSPSPGGSSSPPPGGSSSPPPASSSPPSPPPPSFIQAALSLFIDGYYEIMDLYLHNSSGLASVNASIFSNSPYAGPFAELFVFLGEEAFVQQIGGSLTPADLGVSNFSL